MRFQLASVECGGPLVGKSARSASELSQASRDTSDMFQNE